MKKILASLFVTSVAICSASAANAQVLSATSVHTGTVPSSCGVTTVITALPGTLVSNGTATTPATSLSSDTSPGSFTVTCNVSHSFAAAVITGTEPPLAATLAYKREFRLDAPDAQNAIDSSFVESYTTRSGISAAPNGYNVLVAARISVSDGTTALPVSIANGYVVNIRATIAPGG